MKSIAIFLLVGLSLFHNGNCQSDATEDLVTAIINCLTNVIKESPDLIAELLKILCQLSNAQNTKDPEIIKNALLEVTMFVEKNCDKELTALLDKLLGGSDEDIVEGLDKILNALNTFLNTNLKITKEILDCLCKAIDEITKSGCLNKPLTEITSCITALVKGLPTLLDCVLDETTCKLLNMILGNLVPIKLNTNLLTGVVNILPCGTPLLGK
ncbi:uncharacterized protein LOC120978577 isoform X4 [Bufo bufo]|uniref:uncharacterized protein LOC120978577 isoform X4 n=1 Tax=Bufo bufo TaxID=8384 RepID=UPI001ABE1D88|nr:uncharacterized protein LOC120978577 isoform X4 [Bufo bufo]